MPVPASRPAPRSPVGPVANWFRWYFGRLARRHFAGVHWSAAEDPAYWDPTPILVVANHSTWWDGPLGYLLTAELGCTFHVAMDARHLARHPYFGMIGAHPLRRTNAAERYTDLEWLGRTLLPGSALWIFPQGERRPAAERITTLERGAAHLALTRSPVRIVPVGIRLAHLSEQRPDAFLRVGSSVVVRAGDRRDRRELTREIGARLNANLADVDTAVAAERLTGWRALTPGTLSIDRWFGKVAHRFGLLDGPFEARNG